MDYKYQSLNSDVSSIDISKLKQQYKIKTYNGWQIYIMLTLIASIIPIIVLIVAGFLNAQSVAIVIGSLVVGALVVILMAWSYSVSLKKEWTQKVRLNRFVNDNLLRFIPEIKNPNHAGMIFNIGYDRSASSVIKGKTDEFEIANYSYSVGSGDRKKTYDYGYVMIKLDRNLPNIVLDSVKNNVSIFGLDISNLPVTFSSDQILSLEGDFDSHYKLYAPKEYERDALYIFTPDLMELFIDETGDFDAEIVDDKIYIYSKTIFQLDNELVLRRLFKIIDIIGKKAKRQTDNYVDSLVHDKLSNIVSDSGRRLNRGISWVSIVISAVTIVYAIVTVWGRLH